MNNKDIEELKKKVDKELMRYDYTTYDMSYDDQGDYIEYGDLMDMIDNLEKDVNENKTAKEIFEICDKSHHKGLIYRCPRRIKEDDKTNHIICLGCEIERGESCVYYIKTEEIIELHKITKEEWEQIPEINEDLYFYLIKIGEELQAYRELKKKLISFLDKGD